MFVHTVLFWLKDGLSQEEAQGFRDGVETLREIRSAKQVYVGTPASTDRPVIDRSYDVGLTVVFDDLAQHDAYQVDPIHKEFVERFGQTWERVVIYDFEE